MPYCSVFENIIFVEGDCPCLRFLGSVKYKRTALYNQQLKNLDDVKHQLAGKAKLLGANAIINFTYGQKNLSWLRAALLLLDDNIRWYGSGDAVIISEEKRRQILYQISDR